ncbi:hypothetical protein MHZ95_06300 [Sporosarcina sp. ACRSM]|uniref:hypothetical protein n=1 Tax=Sporosarcina sp. ACRSM TaxID=2918216 RepID=UPI001EF74969|nr:hypothetical protein [Sporosarcina sp. ACRSM]MCG7334881.1 hypothetical protein [Sporosarcina sp. ACRSM]
MNARFFWIALSLIGISWIANSIYAYSKQLDEPIFLDHYIETSSQDTIQMTFYYLANKNDRTTVTSVSAGEWVGYPHSYHLPGEQVYNDQTFTNHVLRKIEVQFDTYLPESDHLEEFSFTEMDVYFSDGTQITAPIGMVKFRPFHYEESPLRQSSSTSSSSYKLAHYSVTEPLTVEAITTSFQEVLQDHFRIKVHTPDQPPSFSTFNDFKQDDWNKLPARDLKDLTLPFTMDTSDFLNLYSALDPDFKAVLDLRISISGTSASGKKFSTAEGYIHYPYLEQKDVNEIIKRKTKEGSDE